MTTTTRPADRTTTRPTERPITRQDQEDALPDQQVAPQDQPAVRQDQQTASQDQPAAPQDHVGGAQRQAGDSRPVRLRPAVHVSTVPDGLLVIGWQSRVLVSGGTALHRLWTAIGPHLNNGVAPEVLLAALPEPARPTVQQLLDRLADSGMLVPVRATVGTSEDTGEDVVDLGSPTIHRLLEFLDSAADSPQDAWHTLRTATVRVTGTGAIAERAITLLRDHGIGTVLTSEQPTDDPVDLILVTDSTPAPTSTEVPSRASVADSTPAPSGIPAVHVLTLSDRAIVLPASPGHQIEPLLRQLSDRGVPTQPAPVPVTVALLAAGQAVVQVIYALAGIATEFHGKLISIQTDRLRISHHPLWPDTGLGTRPLRPDDRAPDDPEHLVDLTDPLTGLLPEALPEHWPQNPFAVAVTHEPAVLGTGVTGAAARYRAGLESARVLLGEHPDVPRGTVVAAGADAGQLVVDLMTRLIERGLETDLVQDAAGPPLTDRDPAVTAARHRLTTVSGAPEPTVQHLRLRRDPDVLAIVVLRDPTGAPAAVALGRDPAEALVRAADHIAARTQCAGRGQAVAQLGLGADLPEEDRPWSGELDRLARAVTGTPVAQLSIHRVGEEHPLGGLGILGWLGTPGVIA